MKNKAAVIFTTLMISGVGILPSYASSESIIHEPSGMVDHDSMRNDSIHQVESLNRAADLQLTDDQKEELVKVLTSYNEARANAEITHEARIEDIEESYNGTIKSVLTPDQINDLNRYNQIQLNQYEKEEKQAMERYEQEYREAINSKTKKDSEGSGPTSPRNGQNPETP